MQEGRSIDAFFDPATGTVSYLIADTSTKRAAIVDPVLDFHLRDGSTATLQADRILNRLEVLGLTVDWILETHAHADHLSAARYLQRRAGGRVAIGERIKEVQSTFKALYNLDRRFMPDGAQFDHLFVDGETFQIGSLQVAALHVPGHTPADIAYVLDGVAFVGDTLFMPDVGTARADFPGGDARTLYRSIRRILNLPSDTHIYVCHDYPTPGRSASWRTTVGDQRALNIHVRDGILEDDFVSMRQRRDAGLEAPSLILPSLQVNIRGGSLPPVEDDGVSYLKIPIDSLRQLVSQPHRA